MDLASLQVFQTVAREHSFSRAAEKLYRTQPAISISIRKLEEWVGQPLFVRGSGARMLTDAGALLLEYADRMLNLREEIRKGMNDLRGLERGQLALGVNESSIHALLPALDRYRRLHPKIHIKVHRVFSRDVPREVLNHHLDIGVISYLPEERDLAAVEFHRDSLVLVVWPGHRLAKRKDVDIKDLGRGNIRRAHRGIALSPARDPDVRAPPRSAANGYRNAHSRKHQNARGNEKRSRHRPAHVRRKRGRARRPARAPHSPDASGQEIVSGIPSGQAAHSGRSGTHRNHPEKARARKARSNERRRRLESCAETQRKAARRPDGIAGKQSSEIQHIQHVGKVLAVSLQLHLHVI